MINKMKSFLCFVTLICAMGCTEFSLQADELMDRAFSEKKYKLSICAIFKNEANYLKEWIEYHRMVGVEHFYLYNSPPGKTGDGRLGNYPAL